MCGIVFCFTVTLPVVIAPTAGTVSSSNSKKGKFMDWFLPVSTLVDDCVIWAEDQAGVDDSKYYRLQTRVKELKSQLAYSVLPDSLLDFVEDNYLCYTPILNSWEGYVRVDGTKFTIIMHDDRQVEVTEKSGVVPDYSHLLPAGVVDGLYSFQCSSPVVAVTQTLLFVVHKLTSRLHGASFTSSRSRFADLLDSMKHNLQVVGKIVKLLPVLNADAAELILTHIDQLGGLDFYGMDELYHFVQASVIATR